MLRCQLVGSWMLAYLALHASEKPPSRQLNCTELRCESGRCLDTRKPAAGTAKGHSRSALFRIAENVNSLYHVRDCNSFLRFKETPKGLMEAVKRLGCFHANNGCVVALLQDVHHPPQAHL